MSTDHVLDILRSVVREIVRIELDGIDRTTTFTDLDIDSLTVVEIVTAVEERLGFRMPADALTNLATIGELESAVRRMAGGPDAVTSPAT